jgi:hypothetical protein
MKPASVAGLLLGLALDVGVGLGMDIPITVRNREAVARSGQPVTSGLPFAQGALVGISKVRLLKGGAEVPAQFKCSALWPDKSVRWLQIDFQADLPASGTAAFVLRTGRAPKPVQGIAVTQPTGRIVVDTGAATFTFNTSEFAVGGLPFEVATNGRTCRAQPASGGWTVEEKGPMKAVLRVEGGWTPTVLNSLVRFRARLVFYRNRDDVRVFLTFRNNNSFGWERGGASDLDLSGASFGTNLLPGGETYVFGGGVEKTWEVLVPASGSPAVVESRYTENGAVATGYQAAPPIAAAAPAYYAKTRAWGPIVLPPSGRPAPEQADYDLFEKLQRAKVIKADVQNPPNTRGYTLWKHLARDLRSWHDYGDLRWGGDFGSLSGNHYDWSYGMFLQFLRTGRLEFADAARVFARHEVDMDIYHTTADGEAFNLQKNWESRPSHDNPANEFGGGRPSHTWSHGYALDWLLTGDPRGRDGFEEILEGVRRYVYESFNRGGYIDTNELRIQGWLTENLVALYRIDPGAVLKASGAGTKTVPQAVKDVLKSVFDREAAAGMQGFVYAGDPPDANTRQPLMNCYALEPLIHAHEEIFRNAEPAYAAKLLALIRRMTDWLISITYGGDFDGAGRYRPLQIPYWIDITQPDAREGQIPYLLMAANAAGYCFLNTGQTAYLSYAKSAFRDYVRYLGVTPGDSYVKPSLRTPACYNSVIYVDTESKIHGWSSRYGQYALEALQK